MKIYQNGPYHVRILPDGAIKVSPGDWLSKYSAAIHNDFFHIYEYGRRKPDGTITPIENTNRILAGEILVHLPTFYGNNKGQSYKAPISQLTDIEKNKIILDALKKDFNLKGENLKIIDRAINILGYTDNALTLAEIAGLITEGGVLSSAASTVSFLSAALFPAGGLIVLKNANESGLRTYGMRAVAYAITGWTFDTKIPKSSQRIMYNLVNGQPRPSAEKIEQYHQAWSEASSEVIKKLNIDMREKNASKTSIQLMFKAIGDNDKRKLCLELLKGFEKELSGIHLGVWKSNYDILFPD